MSATHELSFWRKYVFSTDHKTIGAQYLFTGMIMALIGGYLAYVFRYNLAFPGETIPLFGKLGPNDYNSFVTNHGLIMFFWVAMPILVAAVGNFLIPIQLGTDDMAFPVLNMMSYWIFLLSAIVLMASFFMPGGAFGGGWTMYPPLSVSDFGYNNPNTGFWSNFFTGGTMMLMALTLEFVSLLMGGINFLVTFVNKRAKGMGFFKVPIVVWFVNIASLIFMFSVGPLIAGAFMLFLDRTVGTGFYDAYRGGDPILFQHLFWFFGHPEVYVILLPTLGIVGDILPVFSRKTFFGYRFVIYITLAAAVLSVIVWAHHQFVAGIDPRMATFFSIGTMIISVPFAGLFLAYIGTLWGGNIKLTTPMLWALGMLAVFLIGGLTGLYLGASVFDIYAHDTYFVVAHFHYTVFPIVIFGTFAGFYYWGPKFMGRMFNSTLGKIHFWLTFIFFNGFAFPLFFLGLAGQHRRIANYSMFEHLMQEPYPSLRKVATISAIILILSQLVFLLNFILTMRKKKDAGKNPWQATTLEWQTDSPPGHGNFSEYPVVHHGPYEYSRPDMEEDFLPQNVKLND
jgi:cytochrome c oxidase subunit 1